MDQYIEVKTEDIDILKDFKNWQNLQEYKKEQKKKKWERDE